MFDNPWQTSYISGHRHAVPPRQTRNALLALNVFTMMLSRAAQSSQAQNERRSISRVERSRRRTRVTMQKASRRRNRS